MAVKAISKRWWMVREESGVELQLLSWKEASKLKLASKFSWAEDEKSGAESYMKYKRRRLVE